MTPARGRITNAKERDTVVRGAHPTAGPQARKLPSDAPLGYFCPSGRQGLDERDGRGRFVSSTGLIGRGLEDGASLFANDLLGGRCDSGHRAIGTVPGEGMAAPWNVLEVGLGVGDAFGPVYS